MIITDVGLSITSLVSFQVDKMNKNSSNKLQVRRVAESDNKVTHSKLWPNKIVTEERRYEYSCSLHPGTIKISAGLEPCYIGVYYTPSYFQSPTYLGGLLNSPSVTTGKQVIVEANKTLWLNVKYSLTDSLKVMVSFTITDIDCNHEIMELESQLQEYKNKNYAKHKKHKKSPHLYYSKK